jgi:hypothetical protein
MELCKAYYSIDVWIQAQILNYFGVNTEYFVILVGKLSPTFSLAASLLIYSLSTSPITF